MDGFLSVCERLPKHGFVTGGDRSFLTFRFLLQRLLQHIPPGGGKRGLAGCVPNHRITKLVQPDLPAHV